MFRKAAISRCAAGRMRASTASSSSSGGSASERRNARSASSSSTTTSRPPIRTRRGGRYVPKRAIFRVPLPFAQHLDRKARLVGVDQLGAEFAQPNSIACRAALLRRQGVSYLLPPGAAAVICAASPTLTDLFSSKAGPEVGRRHSGLEQWWPARLASVRIVAAGNSSRFVIINQRKLSPR